MNAASEPAQWEGWARHRQEAQRAADVQAALRALRFFSWKECQLYLSTAALLFCAMLLQAAPLPGSSPRGHSHNDYEHTRPLGDALEYGFTSVEADIYLVNGALLVAHDAAKVSPTRTLQALYLDPLQQRMAPKEATPTTNQPSFLLLIDIKSDADATYRVLAAVLTNYASMLTVFRANRTEPGAVTVILSGNRPRQLVEAQAKRFVAIDGRLEDLATPLSPHLLPLISDNWTKHFTWRGDGPIPPAEQSRLDEMVRRAHQQGCQIRFWATPEQPAGWTVLRDAGVDLLNTDNLAGMKKFLQASPAGH